MSPVKGKSDAVTWRVVAPRNRARKALSRWSCPTYHAEIRVAWLFRNGSQVSLPMDASVWLSPLQWKVSGTVHRLSRKPGKSISFRPHLPNTSCREETSLPSSVSFFVDLRGRCSTSVHLPQLSRSVDRRSHLISRTQRKNIS